MKKNTMSYEHTKSGLYEFNICMSLFMNKQGNVRDWVNTIACHEPNIDKEEYAHNIVGMALGSIGRLLGHEAVKRAVRKYNLADRGWQHLLDREVNWKKE